MARIFFSIYPFTGITTCQGWTVGKQKKFMVFIKGKYGCKGFDVKKCKNSFDIFRLRNAYAWMVENA